MSKVAISFNEDVLRWEDNMPHNEHGQRIRKDLPAGTAWWTKGYQTESITHLVFTCPCGCGDIVSLPVKPAVGYGWEWNQNQQKPTLSPSILRTFNCRWHGYLTDGEFVKC